MAGLLLAKSQKTQVDGWVRTRRRLLRFNDCACWAERSIATSCRPRWMLMNCVGAPMLRMTTRSKAGFRPQNWVFWSSTIRDVVLYSLSTYGPLPAPLDAAELNHFSALSVLSAPARSVAPCARASFEFTIPSDVFATMAGIAVFGVFERRTTVC